MDKRNGAVIKVLGVGGGGGNAVTHMYNQGIVGVDFAICNTDNQALENSDIPIKIHLGPSLTEGMGAGAIPETGKQACIESIDEVRKFLGDGTKMVFITAGMGGGTGTGAAPIIAKAARELGILTVGIVTLPFKFEGMRRGKQAMEGLANLRKNVDSILVISNEKLLQFGDLTLNDAFAKADDILNTAAKGIAEIITKHGKINVDFMDVNTVMKNSGVALMGHAEASGDDRAHKAVREVLVSPLLEENDVRGAKNVLLNIASGNDGITINELTVITNYIQDEVGHATNLIYGDMTDDSLGDKLSITLIATGFEERNLGTKKKEENTTRVSLEDVSAFEKTEIVEETVEDFTPRDLQAITNTEEVENTLKKIQYVEENVEKSISSHPNNNVQSSGLRRASENEDARREYLRSTSSKPLDSPAVISEFESMPAYKRRKVVLDEVSDSDNTVSRHSVSYDDTDHPIIERKNSFLHDNVD